MAVTSSCFTPQTKLDSIVFVGLFLLLMMLRQGVIVAERTCIECDSQLDPDCTDDTKLMPFIKKCPNTTSISQTWCYIAKGKVISLGYKLHNNRHVLSKINITKVTRGCTKEHNEELCTRVKQDGGFTNFKVCHCADDLCNQNQSIVGKPILNPRSGAGRATNKIWGVTLLTATVFLHWNKPIY